MSGASVPPHGGRRRNLEVAEAWFQLYGAVARPPKLAYWGEGVPVLSFVVAGEDSRNGVWYLPVHLVGGSAETLRPYLEPGQEVVAVGTVEGEPRGGRGRPLLRARVVHPAEGFGMMAHDKLGQPRLIGGFNEASLMGRLVEAPRVYESLHAPPMALLQVENLSKTERYAVVCRGDLALSLARMLPGETALFRGGLNGRYLGKGERRRWVLELVLHEPPLPLRSSLSKGRKPAPYRAGAVYAQSGPEGALPDEYGILEAPELEFRREGKRG